MWQENINKMYILFTNKVNEGEVEGLYQRCSIWTVKGITDFDFLLVYLLCAGVTGIWTRLSIINYVLDLFALSLISLSLFANSKLPIIGCSKNSLDRSTFTKPSVITSWPHFVWG